MTDSIRLHYFKLRGMGEPIRLLLTAGGIKFDDLRYTPSDYAAMGGLRARLPFGQLPALEVDGVFLAQTDSLMRFAAKLADLYPHDAVRAAQSDMIVVYQAEIQSAIAKMSFDGVPGAPGTQKVPEEVARQKIDAWFKATLPGMLQYLERQAEGGFMVGTSLCWADICVFNRLTQLLDIEETLLAGRYPHLRAVYERVAGLPPIIEWIDKHADDYPRGHSTPVTE